jgi:tRNA(Arg) A34 adenosine deaminase TadA
MTCAKKTVLAVITDAEGRVLGWGSNECGAPQDACPREPGEGYAKCLSICRQPSHAEIAAISNVLKHHGRVPEGARCRVFGIDRICNECIVALDEFGIEGTIV